jgi:hypothetical protein
MPRLVASPQAAATSHVADVTLEGGVRVSPPEQVATRGGTMQAGQCRRDTGRDTHRDTRSPNGALTGPY